MDSMNAMQHALVCARSVEGRTSPRPPVGAVVVRNGEIIGKGATAPPYGPHAEIQALTQAGPAANGADLYVTLEPCNIVVHTPACTDAIIAAGIRRVIVATLDPNPRVQTHGIEKIRRANIDVSLLDSSTPEAQEAKEIVRPFGVYITQGRPYVTAKWAMTLDGKIASHTGDSYWISGPDARTWVHDLRDRVDAILVGAGTARVDNPQLTVRLPPHKQRWPRTLRPNPPLRVVLATTGHLPASLSLLQPALASGTLVLVGEICTHTKYQQLIEHGVEVLPVKLDSSGHIDIQEAMLVLGQRGIMHVLIEGGTQVLGSAFEHGCIDHITAFIAPKLIGGSDMHSPIGGQGLSIMAQACQVQNLRMDVFNDDVLIEGDITHLDGYPVKMPVPIER
ncbi:MAG: bifunctional diaminohydroxyphosphoribosylaminopyrimidine deaminase/5-amino-6-(5-phosphoribosylamino)uracil reductase RibD [Ktedonobacteraceae bacterium]